MIYRGQQVTVSLTNGETASGWLYAESPLGIYVALDRLGNVIRFIPSGAWESAGYAYDDVVTFGDEVSRAHGEKPAPEVSEKLIREAQAALRRIDYSAARRINEGMAAQASHFRGWYDDLHFEAAVNDDRSSLGDTAITVRFLYVDLLQELEKSGLDRVLLEYSEELRYLGGRSLLPLFDVYNQRFVFEAMLAKNRQGDQIREQDLGRTPLRRLNNSKLARLDDEPEGSKDLKRERTTESGVVPRQLRKTAAVGKMAIGGALAAANVAAGAFAGVIVALPTLGIGTVAGAVAIATSAYTGLNTACDGLKDLAFAIEGKA